MSEPLPDLTVKVKSDVSDAVEGLAEVEAAEKSLGDQTEKTSAKVKKSQKEQGDAVSEFKRLVVANMKDGENAVTSMNKAVDEQRTKLKDLRSDFAQTGKFDTFGDIKKSESDLKSLLSFVETMGGDAARDAEKAGQDAGKGFLSGLADSFSSDGPTGSPLWGLILNPTTLGLGIPALSALVAGAVTEGFGLGVIGIGAMSLRNDPQIKGALSGLKADVAATFTDSASPLINPLVSGLGGIDHAIKVIKPDLTSMFTSAAPGANALFMGIEGFVENGAPEFAKAMTAAAPAVDALGRALPGLGSALGQTLNDLAETPGLADDISIGFGALDEGIRATGFVLDGFGATFHAITLPMQEVHTGFTEIEEVLGRVPMPAAAAGKAMVGALGDVGVAAKAATFTIINSGDAFNQTAQMISIEDDALNALIDTQNTYTSLLQANDNSLLSLDKAQTAFNKELKAGSKNWDESTAAGQKQVGNLNTLNQGITGYYDGLAKLHPLTLSQTSAELDATQKLYDQAKAAGATKDELATLKTEIGQLETQLEKLKNRDVVVSVRTDYITTGGGPAHQDNKAFANSGISFANSGVAGGIPHYDATGIYAGGPQPLYRFAEASTKREALIAENGDSGRAMAALRTAAGWRGQEVVPAGTTTGGGRGSGGDTYITNVITLDGTVLARQLIGPVQRMNARSGVQVYS